jgi:hypothetical protein
MKLQELRNLIRNEVRKAINESKRLKENTNNTDPFPTFKGRTVQEFIKWAVPIFKENNVAKEDYMYWFKQLDNNEMREYNGMTEMELMNVHFGAWFPEYMTEPPSNEPYDVQIKKYRY